MTDGNRLGPGETSVYDVTAQTTWHDLEPRERRLLDGALTLHTLRRPGRPLRVVAVRNLHPGLPRITDWSSRVLDWGTDRLPVALTETRPAGSDAHGDPVDVVVDLGSLEASFTQVSALETSPALRVRAAVRRRAPVVFDAMRQRRTDRLEKGMAPRVPRSLTAPRSHDASDRPDRPRAVLFGLHWLELGGAERWAVECIGAAREQGLVPIVLTDRASSSPWILRPELADAVFVPLTAPMPEGDDAAVLDSLFERFDVRGVHVHHCSWLYERLPWLRTRHPALPVADSLHVLEWRTGGFVDIGVRVSDAVDVHHVISPQLRDYLVHDQQVPRHRVVLATLADLTATTRSAPHPESHDADTPVIAFVGRLTQQKRPYLFLRLAAKLRRDLPGARFVLHGDGELGDEVRSMARRLGLGNVLEFRGVDHSVSATLDQADVLVISSDNEGVTLTTFEADAHGTLVVSADVGSQASVVVDDLLCPRHPLAFMAAARTAVVTAVNDPQARARWAAEQRRKVTAFQALPSARAWTRDLYQEWNA